MTQQQQSGTLGLTTLLSYSEEGLCPGSGVLWKGGSKATLSFGHCLELMITLSDNSAADLVLHRLGMLAVQRQVAEWGMRNTRVYLSQRQVAPLRLLPINEHQQ